MAKIMAQTTGSGRTIILFKQIDNIVRIGFLKDLCFETKIMKPDRVSSCLSTFGRFGVETRASIAYGAHTGFPA
jgi:hypothetical protein